MFIHQVELVPWLLLPLVLSSLLPSVLSENWNQDICQTRNKAWCQGSLCLIQKEDYDIRERPKPGSDQMLGLPPMKESNESHIPCCPSVQLSESTNKTCEEFRVFEAARRGQNATVVWLDFQLQQVTNLSLEENHLEVKLWLQMSWIDNRLSLFNCQRAGKAVVGETFVELERAATGLWLPDLHLLEARRMEVVSGLTRQGGKVRLIPGDGGDTRVVYDVELKAELACRFVTRYFPLDRNKCTMRFGSYNHDRSEVVFQQKSGHVFTRISHSSHTISSFPLQLKDKQVIRHFANRRAEFDYDGLQLIITGHSGRLVMQYMVNFGFLVCLALLSVWGFPNNIERSGLFAMVLLGSSLLFVDATSNTPHGTYLHGLMKTAIGLVMVCFGSYCILLVLMVDGMLTEKMQFVVEFIVAISILVGSLIWLYVEFTQVSGKAERDGCHNF